MEIFSKNKPKEEELFNFTVYVKDFKAMFAII